VLGVLAAGQAAALGLGEIELDSALNEPLRAEIRLISATAEELENLTIQIASTETFTRYGLDRPAYLSSVNFRVVPSGRAAGNVVRVTSSEPITEPFLTFLVEANWASGRLLREYTVLLDPATFAPPAEQMTDAVQAPSTSQAADSGQINRPAPSQTQAPAPTPVVTESPATVQSAPADNNFDTTPGGNYDVTRGDTLWGIANRYTADGLTVNQTMLAIFEANPQAFEGNINALSAGASLRIPSADEIFRITRTDALAEVQRQNSDWGGPESEPAPVATVAQPSLELVPPDEDTLSDDSSTVYDGPELADEATVEAGADDIRIEEIEALLGDQQDGLVNVSDNELAALRRELAELRGEEVPIEPVVDAIDEGAADDVFAADETPADEDVFADDAQDAVDAVTAEAETVEAAPVITPRPQEPGLVERIIDALTGIWGMIGLGVLLALGVLLFFARRAAREGSAEDATAIWTGLDDDAGGTSQVPAMDRDDNDTMLVEESGPSTATANMTETMEIGAVAPAPEDDFADATAETSRNEALDPNIDDTFSSDTALNLDQSDPIAEADFHMAYGLYDQAADLVNGAIAVEPQRADLLAKLCEIYFVWGNRDAFVDAAARFKGLLNGGEDPEWDKTVIMGQQIAGDHELFTDAPAGATKNVDLAFDDGDEAALDMDFAAPGDSAGGDVIDLGAEDAAPAAASNETNSAIDFVFDEVDSGTTGITEEMQAPDPFDEAFADDQSPTAEVTAVQPSEVDEATAEMPTVETSLDDTAEAPELAEGDAELDDTGLMAAIGDEEATRVAGLDDEDDAAAEIDLDDLELDLEGLDGDAAVADLDDTSKRPAIEENLLDATGQTQVLGDDFDIETGTGSGVAEAMGDDDQPLTEDADSLLASLDDEFAESQTGGDFDFASTETISADSIDIPASADTGEVPGGADMDLDLDDLTAALRLSTEGDTVNQPRAEADTAGETVSQPRPDIADITAEDSPTTSLSESEMSGDLQDARTMTEVGTKLDLARAYVDMGDPEGARSILDEVLDEGDDGQRQQAQQLLDTLPA